MSHFAETNFKHAMASLQVGKLNEAEQHFKKVLQHDPRNIAALNLLGMVLAHLQKYNEAERFLQSALKLDSSSDATFYNYGIVLKALNRPQEALERFNQALSLNVSSAETWNNRGTVLSDLKRYEDAVADFNKAIGLQPNLLMAFYNKGNSLVKLGCYDDAFAAYDKALALKPDFAEAWLGRGNVFGELRRYDDAFAAYDKALVLKPDLAEAWLGRGNVFGELRRHDEAFAAYDEAISRKQEYADAYYNKALLLLRLGNYEEGWKLNEWRWLTDQQREYKRRFTQPLWLGDQSLAEKTILLYSEQGMGDTIQFCRYAKLVADLSARVILEVPKPLVSLLSNLSGVAQIAETGTPEPTFDIQCPLMSLPLAFKTTVSTIPANIPYIKAPAEKSIWWKKKLGEKNKLRIGLVWSGGFSPSVNKRRNLPLTKLAALKNPDIEFYSLQKGQPAESELSELIRDNWDGPNIIDFTNLINDFSDTAALIENLDLVISVDTSTAHLAGAMGKPVWILNRYDTDWRWLLDRTDSPWYPTAKLYRQETAGDWDEVVRRVKTDLFKLVSPRHA